MNFKQIIAEIVDFEGIDKNTVASSLVCLVLCLQKHYTKVQCKLQQTFKQT